MDFTKPGPFYRGNVQPIVGFEIILFIVAAISLLLNFLLVYITLSRERAKYALDTILLCIIAGLDSGSSLLVIVSQLSKWLTDYAIVFDGSLWCHLNSVLHWSLSLASLNIVALLSLIRYLVIVRGHRACNYRWTCAAIAIVVLIFISFIIQDFVNTPMVFPSSMFCAAIFPDDNTPIVILLKIGMLLILLPPFFIIPFCYFSVTSYYHQIISKLSNNSTTQILQHYRRKFKGFIFIILAYLIALLPEYTYAFLSILFKIPLISWVDSIFKILFFCVTIVNVLFTLFFHEEIYNCLKNILDRNQFFYLETEFP